MAKTITAMMPDGQPVKLEGVPDDVTPEQGTARIQQEYGATPISLSREGGGNPILGTAKVYGSGLLRGVTSAGAMAKDAVRNTYEGLTQAVQGKSQPFAGRFLHHRPASDSQAKNSMEGLSYFRMLVDYFSFFKEPPPKDIWPYSYELFGDATDWELQGGICIAPCWTYCEA